MKHLFPVKVSMRMPKIQKVAVAYDNLTKELIKNQKVKHKDEMSL